MKYVVKRFLGCCIICAVIGFALFLAGIFTDPLTRSKKAEAKNLIMQLYRLIDYTAIAKGYPSTQAFLSAQSETNTPALFLESIISHAVESEGIIPPSVLHNKKILDPWGKPLNVAWYSSIIKNVDAQNLLQVPLSIVIWSSGENGRNEFGEGDDIFIYDVL